MTTQQLERLNKISKAYDIRSVGMQPERDEIGRTQLVVYLGLFEKHGEQAQVVADLDGQKVPIILKCVPIMVIPQIQTPERKIITPDMR